MPGCWLSFALGLLTFSQWKTFMIKYCWPSRIGLGWHLEELAKGGSCIASYLYATAISAGRPWRNSLWKTWCAKLRLGGKFSIDSAATSTEEIGELPHPGTLKKLREQGISTHAHHARQVRATEYGEWDLFVYMDRENLHGLESIFGGDPQKKFVRLLDFLPDDDPRHGKDVADPWYTGNFDATYRDVVAGCRGLLSKLEGER